MDIELALILGEFVLILSAGTLLARRASRRLRAASMVALGLITLQLPLILTSSSDERGWWALIAIPMVFAGTVALLWSFLAVLTLIAPDSWGLKG